MVYVRNNFGTDRQMQQRANRVYREKLVKALDEQRRIINEAQAKGVNPMYLLQHALSELEQRKRQ